MADFPSDSPGPVVIPDHELLRPVGRGSYGEVWLARSVLGELRAVKIVRRSSTLEDRASEREFEGLRKFEPVSRSHPGLVHILHAGRFEGGFYYVMELADAATAASFKCSVSSVQQGIGDAVPASELKTEHWKLETYVPRTLRSDLRLRGRLPVAECVELALQLTDALAHLHAGGLVHRDLKPSNIIFVQGRPKLADIGLVASADASMSCVGTEGYLPPEGPGKPTADLYALGKVLYELATGRDRTDFPELPTLLREDPERAALEELNEVLLKACDPDLHRRYQTARQMRADLLLMQGGHSLRAARTLRRRLVFARRAGAVVAVAALLAVAGYFYQESQTREARRLTQSEAEQRARAEGLVGTLQLKQAERFFEKDEGGQGVAYLARMLRQNPGNHLAAARLMSALNHRSFALPLRVFEFPEETEDLEFSPDGARFLTWSRGTNPVARLWDVASAQGVGRSMPHVLPGVRPRFSPDGRCLATVSTNRTVQLFDAANGEPTGIALPYGEHLANFCFSADGQRLLTTGGSEVQEWSIPQGERTIPTIDTGNAEIIFSVFSPDRRKILTGAYGPLLGVWDAATGAHLMELEVGGSKRGGLKGLQFSQDGARIAAASDLGLHVWDAESGRLLHRLRHDTVVWEMDFSPDGLRLVTGDGQRWVRIWDVQTGQLLIHPIRHSQDLWAARFDPTGERLLTREHSRARLWDSRTGKPLTEWMGGAWKARFSPDGRHLLTSDGRLGILRDTRPGAALNLVLHHRNRVTKASFSTGGDRLVVVAGGRFNERPNLGHREDLVALWDARTGDLAAPGIFVPNTGSGELSPDGATILTGSGDGRAQLWDSQSAQAVGPPMRHDDGVASARFSKGGARIATAAGNSVRIWDARTQRPVTDLLTASNAVGEVEFSADDRWVLLHQPWERTVQIWDQVRQDWLQLADTEGTEVADAHFSPDGSRMVGSRGDQPAASIWELATGALVATMRHQDPVRSARYSPDGRRLVTTANDRTARVWDAHTFQPVGEPMLHDGLLTDARFSADGRRVITVATVDHAARVWDADTGQPLSELLRHADWTTVGEFSPDGLRVLTASFDGTARIHDLPPGEAPVPGWLLDLAEAVAGLRLVDHERPEPVSAREFLALRERVSKSEAIDRHTIWAKWFLEDRLDRGVSHASSVRGTTHLDRLREWNSVATLREALLLAPEDAEANARLARAILATDSSEYPQPERTAAFLAERAASLAPDAWQTWWAKAEVLAHTNRLSEALAALERGLRQAPDIADLWRRKAGWLEQSGELEAALLAYTQAIALLAPTGGGSAGSEPWGALGPRRHQQSGQENSLHPAGAATYRSPSSEHDALRETRLKRTQLLERLGRHDDAVAARLEALGIPARDPATPASLLDLSPYYNRSFVEQAIPWEAFSTDENFATLPQGVHVLAGVRFDLRGVILTGTANVPEVSRHLAGPVQGIRVHQHCRQLHFLHVLRYRHLVGAASGRYIVHYEDGSRAEIPILQNETIGFWPKDDGFVPRDLARAWTGSAERTPATGTSGYLYRYGWKNPKPGLRIETVDLEPSPSASPVGYQAMLLVAISAQNEPEIAITSHPKSQRVTPGEPATFRVEAQSEAPLAYQWQFEERDIPGATNATLTIGQAALDHVGGYSVEVRDGAVGPVLSLTSEPAALMVRAGDVAFGGLRREVFLNLPGGKLTELTNFVRFPDQPDITDFVSQFEVPTDFTNYYGVRLTGFIVPPTTGKYRFYLCSDDEGTLSLSPDDTSENRRLIAHEPVWNGWRRWTTRFHQSQEETVAPAVHLEAGRRYFVEALMKEGDGRDHLGVAWQLPGGTEPANGAPPIPGRYLAVPAAWLETGE
ncbi:MAG: protein kinase [Verrucomicrobia bacterium]|nr:protein kinase [Verrucomicrobiota bacterium]